MNKVYRFKTLMGNRNIGFSIECLKSFIQHSENNIRLTIYEDGSFTHDDVRDIHSELKDTTIVFKHERDKILKSKLAYYPECWRYRESTVYAHKLIDVMMFEEDDLFFIDSDVLFLQKFRLPVFSNSPAFILDKQNAYSFRPMEFLKIRFPIFPKVNTGLFYFPRHWYSLDYLEELLSDDIIAGGIGRISWLEQTLWSFLAARSNSINYFDERQISMARQELAITSKSVAVHLVSTYRFHYDYLHSIMDRNDGPASQIALKDSPSFLSKYEFITERFKKKLFRRIGFA